MYSKKFATMALMPQRSKDADQLTNIGVLNGSPANNRPTTGGSGKQRLRWTSDLHDRFVDALTQLGGPDKTLFKGYSEYEKMQMKNDKWEERSAAGSTKSKSK